MGKRQVKKSNTGLWVVGGVAVLAVALLIGLQAASNKGGGAPATTATDTAVGGARNVKGKDSAKVTLIEYGDYL